MNYEQILEEHIRRARQRNDPSYQDRAKLFIDQAVRDLARCYHQYPLERRFADSSPVNDIDYILPLDLQTLINFEIRQASALENLYVLESNPDFASHAATRQSIQKVRPTSYSRFNRVIEFNSLPDQDYVAEVYYYAYPSTPDYTPGASTTPEFELVWHPHIIEYSLVIAGHAVSEMEVSGQAMQSLQMFFAMMPDAQIAPLTWTAPRHREADVSRDAL